MDLTFWWTTVYVTDMGRSLEFYRDKLGLHLRFADDEYASLRLGHVLIELSKEGQDEKDAAKLVGRETGIGLGVPDIQTAHEELVAKGVEFRGPPEKQPWGDILAIMVDPDGNGNTIVLDQLPPDGLTEEYLHRG